MTSKPGKQPEDRKAKDDGPTFETIEVEVGEGDSKRTIPARRATIQGLEITIEDRRLNDYRISKLMSQSRRGDMAANAEALELLVGEEQHEKIIASCADEDGFVTQADVAGFVEAMFKAISPNS